MMRLLWSSEEPSAFHQPSSAVSRGAKSIHILYLSKSKDICMTKYYGKRFWFSKSTKQKSSRILVIQVKVWQFRFWNFLKSKVKILFFAINKTTHWLMIFQKGKIQNNLDWTDQRTDRSEVSGIGIISNSFATPTHYTFFFFFNCSYQPNSY